MTAAMADVPLRVGIVTVSDRVQSGAYADRGGPAVRAALAELVASHWTEFAVTVPDEQAAIAQALAVLADDHRCDLILTTGGTGLTPRDVTPEATIEVCDRVLPGFGEAMRAASLATVPTAILSRQTAGHRGACLIVNLPGSPGGAAECLAVVMPAIAHAVVLLGGPEVTLTGTPPPDHD